MNINLQTLVEVEKQFKFILDEHEKLVAKQETAEFLKSLDTRRSALYTFFTFQRQVKELLEKHEVEVTE